MLRRGMCETGWKHRENVKTYYEVFMPGYTPPGKVFSARLHLGGGDVESTLSNMLTPGQATLVQAEVLTFVCRLVFLCVCTQCLVRLPAPCQDLPSEGRLLVVWVPVVLVALLAWVASVLGRR